MNPNNRNLNFIAFFLGLAAVTWIALGYVGGNTLALGVSCTIAVVYVVGAFEMRRFHGDTAALARALPTSPAGTRVMAPEWVWQAAQGGDVEALVDSWLGGAALPVSTLPRQRL